MLVSQTLVSDFYRLYPDRFSIFKIKYTCRLINVDASDIIAFHQFKEELDNVGGVTLLWPCYKHRNMNHEMFGSGSIAHDFVTQSYINYILCF